MSLRILIAPMISAVAPALVLAQSGYQTINGTRVFTQVFQDRGYAEFSNACGRQRLTQSELQAGRIPDDIIPCPRPEQANPSAAACAALRDQWNERHRRPFTPTERRSIMCIPGVVCEATCSDYQDYASSLDEELELDRKWVTQCNGTLVTVGGQTIDKNNIGAIQQQRREQYLRTRSELCRTHPADQSQDVVRSPSSAPEPDHQLWAALDQNAELSSSLAYSGSEAAARRRAKVICLASKSASCAPAEVATADLKNVFVTVCCPGARITCETAVAASAAQGVADAQQVLGAAGLLHCSLRQVLSAETGEALPLEVPQSTQTGGRGSSPANCSGPAQDALTYTAKVENGYFHYRIANTSRNCSVCFTINNCDKSASGSAACSTLAMSLGKAGSASGDIESWNYGEEPRPADVNYCR